MASGRKAEATSRGRLNGDQYRKLAIVSCSVAIGALVPVALLQLGFIENLPDPPGRIFNSKRIVTSKSAHPLGIPDSLLGFSSYGVTLTLLVAASPSRPLVRGALRAKLLLDATIAAKKARGQRKKFGQVCSWCLLTAAATIYTSRCARMARRADRHSSR